MGKLKPTQKAYIAGFLDADGSISIAGGTNKRGHQHWALQLLFYNCNLEVLETIQKLIGIGSIYKRKRSSLWRVNYTLKFQGAAAVRLLKEVEKYMIVKKRQAKIALEFAKTVVSYASEGSSWQGTRKLKPEIIDKRIKLKKMLQAETLTANYVGKNVN